MEQILGLLIMVIVAYFVWRSMQMNTKRAEPNRFVLPGTRSFISVDVVGESFYKENFKKLKAKYGSKNAGESYSTRAILINETDNSHSRDGKAVRVEVDGLTVGHVPSTQLKDVFASIEQTGGRKSVRARLYFADQRFKVASNSVQLELRIAKS